MSKKPPETERTPGCGLPRMTPGAVQVDNRPHLQNCCNYDYGNCLCVFPQEVAFELEEKTDKQH